MTYSRWFPIIRDGDTVVIAANDPSNPAVLDEARRMVPAGRYEVWVALAEDIQWYIQDFLHAKVGQLIGTERTGLAFWRNTWPSGARGWPAIEPTWRWRARTLRCCDGAWDASRLPTAFCAPGETTTLPLVHRFVRRRHRHGRVRPANYLRVRQSRLGPPGHTTLVEVTAATVAFLERFHDIEGTEGALSIRRRCLRGSATFGTPLHDPHAAAGKQGTHPPCAGAERAGSTAHDRSSVSYALRARPDRAGLYPHRRCLRRSRIGLMRYFGLSVLTALDAGLIVAGLFMAIDGADGTSRCGGTVRGAALPGTAAGDIMKIEKNSSCRTSSTALSSS